MIIKIQNSVKNMCFFNLNPTFLFIYFFIILMIFFYYQKYGFSIKNLLYYVKQFSIKKPKTIS
jgi:hypothetical protein